jgi:hypothetical protein
LFLIEKPEGARGEGEVLQQPSAGPSRARRLFGGWSANLVQTVLGITQQVVLIPVFLHFWTSGTLAAWLAVYAAGNLMLIADAGLHFRAINRFLSFKSAVDCDGRTARLARINGLQLAMFLILSIALIRPFGPFGGGYRDRRQRPVGAVRLVGARHNSGNASAAVSSHRLSGDNDGCGDALWMGIGNAHQGVVARLRRGAICRRVHSLAGGRGDLFGASAQQSLSRQVACLDSALK